MRLHLVMVTTLILGSQGIVQAEPDAARGLTLYQSRCVACHSVAYNGVGPAHQGIFGRKAGSAPNYVYSAALKASNETWTEKTLSSWLADPEKFIPGQKMGVSVQDVSERQDLIAYLKTLGTK